MKIRVTTKNHEYQGLYAGSEHEVIEYVRFYGVNEILYSFKVNGKIWYLYEDECELIDEQSRRISYASAAKEECRSSYCECEEGKCSGGKVDMRADEANNIKSKANSEKKTPIKSDGGSYILRY